MNSEQVSGEISNSKRNLWIKSNKHFWNESVEIAVKVTCEIPEAKGNFKGNTRKKNL